MSYLQDHKVDQAPEKNCPGWRTNAGKISFSNAHALAIHAHLNDMYSLGAKWVRIRMHCFEANLRERTTYRIDNYTVKEIKVEIRF